MIELNLSAACDRILKVARMVADQEASREIAAETRERGDPRTGNLIARIGDALESSEGTSPIKDNFFDDRTPKLGHPRGT